jgi:hypothetical protein
VNLRVSHFRRFGRATMSEVFSGISTRSSLFGQPARELVPIRKPESKSYQLRHAKENLVQMRAVTSQLNQR